MLSWKCEKKIHMVAYCDNLIRYFASEALLNLISVTFTV